jgi:4Fe-4S single cluster domain
MFAFKDLHHIQVEITNRCQASCPMCLRNIHGGIDNPLLQINDWTLSQFIQIFNAEILSQIQYINFCGDFGDPILNNDLIGMCQYVKDNSNVSIHIHTNGSARNIEWWSSLAKALPNNHMVEFAIDGLRDTHSLYRIGTDYDIIIRNAIAFMEAGGNAHWMYIKFKHNEHQIDIARNISNTLGFKTFDVKTSKRFGKQFPVLDRAGNVTHYIEQASSGNVKPIEFIDLKDYKSWKIDVSCFAFDGKELYIDAHGHLMPCCLIASFLYANYDTELHNQYKLIDSTSVVGLAKQVQDEVYDLINEFGGLDSLDANIHGIKYIMNQPIWQELIHKKWDEHASSPCTILCGTSSPYIKVKDQINRT